LDSLFCWWTFGTSCPGYRKILTIWKKVNRD
jgi:hypothetical protein